MSNYEISYGVYDLTENRYRYLFTVSGKTNSDSIAIKQFIGYCVGSSDLFVEDLELHKIAKIGQELGDITTDFCSIIKAKDIYSRIEDIRKAEYKRLHPLEK